VCLRPVPRRDRRYRNLAGRAGDHPAGLLQPRLPPKGRTPTQIRQERSTDCSEEGTGAPSASFVSHDGRLPSPGLPFRAWGPPQSTAMGFMGSGPRPARGCIHERGARSEGRTVGGATPGSAPGEWPLGSRSPPGTTHMRWGCSRRPRGSPYRTTRPREGKHHPLRTTPRSPSQPDG